MAAQEQGGIITYSFVHISDTQNLATRYPDTYNLTFSSLESMKKPFNVSAIIITGDLVNGWDRTNEWEAYVRARNLTTIPVYDTAGNHDTSGGNEYRFYMAYTGMPRENYVTSIGDLDLVGINYAGRTYPEEEFLRLRTLLDGSLRSNAIIATHYYMNEDGAPSLLGDDIDRYLIRKPALILTGHMHGDFITDKTISGIPVMAEMTNYQDGIPGGSSGQNYAAGTLYTMTSGNGHVERITARVIHLYPVQPPEPEVIVFARDTYQGPGGPVSGLPAGTLTAPSCSFGSLPSMLDGFIRTCRAGLSRIFTN